MKAITRVLMATGLMVTATAASAHAGHDAGTGFASGLLHPMAAIGFWSVRQSSTLKNSTPLFVIGGMILGAGIAWSGLSLPGVETGIALSVLLAGILIATMAKLPTVVGGTLVAAFMVFHGFAHGTEMPAGAALVAYLIGFSIATLTLTLFGQGLGAAMMKADGRLGRALGGLVAGAGAFLAAA